MGQEENLRVTAIGALRDDLRELLEAHAKIARRIDRGNGGRELAIVRTKLQEADYWLRDAAETITNNHD